MLIGLGTAVFALGTLAIWRLPDCYCRLHALTKIDNLGLGLLALGLALLQPDWIDGVKIVTIWLLLLCSSATTGPLIAQRAIEEQTR
nr:monovalent cation/H(+) antiporter subunit G [Motiliproteus sediminis]